MLKKASNFVLGSKASSMYPRGYTCGVFFACGLVGRPFSSIRTVLKIRERAYEQSN
jgi:hypothetical protein